MLDDRLVRDLAILTTQAEPTAALKLLAARNDVDGVISMLLDDQRFTNKVVPSMLLEDYRFTAYLSVHSGLVLKRSDPTQPYYLKKPCKVVDSTSVEPWWAPETRVQVCNEAYRPDVIMLAALPGRPTATPPLCGSSRHGQLSTCGCGRNLIHCTRDPEMRNAVRGSLGAEVFDTIGHVVTSGAPMQSIYLDNATVRDRNAEMYYRMHGVARGQPWKQGLEAFARPTYMPRTEDFEGEHAGILTTTDLARFTDVPRSEMMEYFALMTCSSSDGAHVNGHQALAINTSDIRLESGGKDYLAHAVGCTNCHARMENAIQFFAAWRGIFHSAEIEPELQVIKQGNIYLNNIDDLRGTTKTTPAAFAAVVTAQPEFATCQARRVIKYIFNAEPEPVLHDRLSAMITARKPAREVLKVALRAYVDHVSRGAPAPAPAPSPSSLDKPTQFDDAAVRTFDKPLVAALGRCDDCHGDGDGWIDKTIKSHDGTALHLLRMADMVASEAMPKKIAIPRPEREAIVTKLCQAAWGDAQLGLETAEVLLGHRRPASVQEFETVIGLFEALEPPGTADEPWKVPELMMRPGNNFLTPGTAATYGFEALRSCRARFKSPAEIEQCVDGLLEDGAYLRVQPQDLSAH